MRTISIKFSAERARFLGEWLDSQRTGIRVDVRAVTGSIIIFYDPEQTVPAYLVRLVENGLETCNRTGIAHHPADIRTSSEPSVAGRHRSAPHSLRYHVWWLVALTGSFLYSLIRILFFKLPLAQGPFSLLGGIALLGSLPLVRRAVDDFRHHRSKSLFPFLAGSSVAAVALGEAVTALEVLWVTHLSMLLEGYVEDKSRRAIRETLEVASKNAFILKAGRLVEIPASQLQAGNTAVIYTGGKIPADGTVLSGTALVDEASITGRSEPAIREPHHFVYQGTIVQQGSLTIRAEKVGDDTYINRMLYLVEESLAHRAPVEQRADLLAARLLSVGALSTVGTFLATGHIMRTLTVMLVVACPCATALAAATAIAAALANAARNRCLIKGGLYLEKIGEANCFCFDKTGTITIDAPHVDAIVSYPPSRDPSVVLLLAASAEENNTHPLARAITREAAQRGLNPVPASVSEVVIGKGVRAAVGQDTIIVGSTQYLHELEVVLPADVQLQVDQCSEQGHTVILVMKNSELQGIISISNTVRAEAKTVLQWLREDRVDAHYLLTGDMKPVAKALSGALGFDDYRASLLPEEKARFIDHLQAGGQTVVMVGDGVNDALALSRAGIGIAMGAGGSEAAIEAADIALVDSNFERLIMLRQLSHETLRIIEQNFWLATSTNVMGIVLGAAGWITPLVSGLHHIIHTLGVMLNSSRLLRWKPKGTQPAVGFAQGDLSTHAFTGVPAERRYH